MVGRQIWKEFTQSQTDFLKAQAFIPEAAELLREACLCFDASAYHGVAILCRAVLESAFIEFLGFEWTGNNSFNIVSFPTTLDGKPRDLDYDELKNGIAQKVVFPREQQRAISRIREDGNFVAHIASRRIKQRFDLSKSFKRWQVSNVNVSDLETVKAINKLLESRRQWVTHEEALKDLRDTSSIILTLCKAMG